MSIKDLTITDQNVQSVYVQSQPDRLTGTAQQNKAVFDALPQLIIQRFNLLLDALAGTGAAGEIPVGPIEGVTAENVQQALSAIQQNLTAYIDKIKSAVGAYEVGVSPISGLEASNVQAALQALRTIQSMIDQNIKKIMSEQGAATVGSSPVRGMAAQNVQQALEELRTAIDNIVSGISPGGTIKAEMIDPAAIVQLGALLAVAAAAAYDPEGSYAVGDYCTHGGKLHKCSTTIDGGEVWNAAHWTATTVAAEIAAIQAELANKAPAGYGLGTACITIDDWDNAIGNGWYRNTTYDPNSHSPDNFAWYGFVIRYSANLVVQIVYHADSLTVCRSAFRWYYQGTWSEWIYRPTATPPQVRDLTLQSGFMANGDCTFFVTQESAVFLAGGVSGTLPANQDTQIGTLPADARPSAQRRRPAVTNAGAAYIDIHTDGTVWAHPFAAASQCWFDCSFVAGGGS